MAINQPDPIKLVHTMAHALRHDPGKYGLEPDAEGWVSFDDLIIAVRFERDAWLDLTRCDIERLLIAMESDRFEIVGAKIRAVYGHSINLEKPPPIQNPPETLFHGTSADNVAEIMANRYTRPSSAWRSNGVAGSLSLRVIGMCVAWSRLMRSSSSFMLS